MANPEHLAILQQGVKVWNQWRKENPYIEPNLSGTDISGADLRGAYLLNTDIMGTDIRGADLTGADLRVAYLGGANLREANLRRANLREADLHEADFSGADICMADLHRAYLREADLRGADISEADLCMADIRGARLNNAKMGANIFGDIDLSQTIGLETVIHSSPSIVGIDTIYKSGGKIPASFLLGCGVPQSFIDYIPSLIGAIEPFQYHSCFISYSTKDDAFAKRLHSRLRAANVRVWFAPEDMKGGRKIHEQIEQAIQVHDRLLLVLSEHSIRSNWVETEIRRALEVEKRENRRKLFPIRLAEFETLRKWRCFDADSGRDLAVGVREYFLPDFSNWKDHDSFEKGFERLLRDLKEAE